MTATLAALVVAAQLGASATAASQAASESRVELRVEAGAWLVAVPRQDATDFRPRLIGLFNGRPGSTWRVHTDVTVDALIADRRGEVTDLVVDVRDAWIEASFGAVDVRAGFGRLPWGRLDEVQPTDLINPLDSSRLLLHGRAEARRAVTFARVRVTASEALRFEGVLAPVFRRGIFDALDEPTSPFNLRRDLVLPAGATTSGEIEQREPETSWGNLSGGGRVDATIGRVDVGVAVYRGFDAFGPVVFEVAGLPPMVPDVTPAVVGTLVENHPRFTMVGGDFETVTGEWAWRGEAAAIVERTFAGVTRPGLVRGHAFDGGAGFDRRAGEQRLYGSVLVHRDWSSEDPAIAKTDVSVVGSIDRRFDRDRWLVRAFALVNPADRSGFIRGLVTWTPRDHLAIDISAGAFVGTGDDTISRFRDRDFLLIGVRVF